MKTRTVKTPILFRKAFCAALILLILSCSQTLDAQCYSHKKKPIGYKQGEISLNAGIGLLPTFRGKHLSVPVLPLSTILTYRLKKNVTAGFYLGYSLTEAHLVKEEQNTLNAERSKPDEKTVRNNFYIAGLRLEGHYIHDRVDFYGGAMLAYNFSDIDSNLSKYQEYTNIRVENYADAITWSGHIGLKYLLTKNIGIFGEIGYGVSVFVFGTSFKL